MKLTEEQALYLRALLLQTTCATPQNLLTFERIHVLAGQVLALSIYASCIESATATKENPNASY